VGRKLPGHSCGGSPGMDPVPSARLAAFRPGLPGVRDVAASFNPHPRHVQLWHAPAATDAPLHRAGYAPSAP
jgi:hypothetical protein